MLFSSIVFLYYFLPITMGIYWVLPFKYKNIFCFLASLFFYAWGEPVYVFLMLGSILVNYILGLGLGKYKDKKMRKLILNISIVFNLGLLIIFKYTGFILKNLWGFLNVDYSVPQIALPLGISFFTFQAMSYVIDVYREDAKVQGSFMKLGLYIFAFPQLIAGPIVRYNTVMDQIEYREVNLEKLARGIVRFSLGLGKKIIFANQFGLIADRIFIRGQSPSTALGAWIGILAYTLQIFFDFSGYSDMAIGLGKMLGFDYDENFNYPYISSSVSEFWRRWHISLSTWFKDYLYIPLGGNRVKVSKHIRNLFIVWLATGFWHGAEWTFLFWGFYYFILLVGETYVVKEDLRKKIPSIFRHAVTMVLVMVGWVLFRAVDLLDAYEYIMAMFNIKTGDLIVNSKIILNDSWYIFLGGLILSTPVIKNTYGKFKDKWENVSLVIESSMVVLILVISTMYLINSTYNPFIYFRF